MNFFSQLASGAIIPMEFCDVIEGQIMRKQLSPAHTKSMVELSTKKPQDRLNSIREGLGVRHRISDWVKYLYLLLTCFRSSNTVNRNM